jgi:hypothetical protein
MSWMKLKGQQVDCYFVKNNDNAGRTFLQVLESEKEEAFEEGVGNVETLYRHRPCQFRDVDKAGASW